MVVHQWGPDARELCADKRTQRELPGETHMSCPGRALSRWPLRASRQNCHNEKSFKHQRPLPDHLGHKRHQHKGLKCFHHTGSIYDKDRPAAGRRAGSTRPHGWWNLDGGSEALLLPLASFTWLPILHIVNRLDVAADCKKERKESWFLSFLWRLCWEKCKPNNSQSRFGVMKWPRHMDVFQLLSVSHPNNTNRAPGCPAMTPPTSGWASTAGENPREHTERQRVSPQVSLMSSCCSIHPITQSWSQWRFHIQAARHHWAAAQNGRRHHTEEAWIPKHVVTKPKTKQGCVEMPLKDGDGWKRRGI